MGLGKKTIDDQNYCGKKVLVRCDFNVPMKDGVITNENRINAALPTIQKLVNDGAKVILCSHLGKPKNGPEAKFSLAPVAVALSAKLGKTVVFADDDNVVGENAKAAVAAMNNGDVVLLQNTRFRKEETKNLPEFSQDLASLADAYVDDAFGSCHRAHCSTAGVTDYIKDTAVGYLMEKEIKYLGNAVNDPVRPFTAILGGAKVADYMAEVVNGAETNVAIIEGLPSEHTTARMGGFSDRVAEKYPNIHVVASQSGDWEREKGMNAAANMMQSVDIDAFFGLCDEMSLGAVQAVKQANGKQLVFSFDGNPNAAEAVKSGDLMCTLSIGGLKTGEECVNMIDKILKGETVDKFFTIETEVITKDNVDAYLATFE